MWRRVAESNRSKRICNPLHNLFANPPSLLLSPPSMRNDEYRYANENGTVAVPLFLLPGIKLERQKSLELSTSTLARLRSTN